jgi:hypothetical protein
MPAELDNMDPEMDQEMDSGMDQEMGADEPEMDMGDQEGAMAKQELIKLANYASNLQEHIADDEQLEAWVQSKITIAATNIASVYHYLAYEKKIGEYGDRLDSEPMSESKRQALKGWLMEAKSKVKELKKAHAEKVKEKKIEEGALSGGERACTECGGTGMVYEEPKAVPDHVKGKVEKYNTMMKATKAAHKRMDANHNGIPDDEEVDESFDEKSKEGDTFKTKTGVATKTSTGVKHTNTSYKDDGEAEEKSGKGVKSHAKAQSAAEKKEKAPAQKQSPKSAKTWGMKDGEKFDNRDKEKDVGEGVYEAKKKGDGNLANNAKPYDKVTRGDVIAGRLGKDEKGGKTVKEAAKQTMSRAAKGHEKYGKEGMAALAKAGKEGKDLDKIRDKYDKYDESAPSAGLSKAKKSATVKDAKAGKDIGKPGKGFDKLAKKAGGGEKGEKIAAAAMWKNIKETTAYMAEKKAAAKKIKDVETDEGNEFSGELKKARDEHKDSFKVDGKTFPVKESSEVSRLRELTGRLNQNEKTSLNENDEVNNLRRLSNFLKG